MGYNESWKILLRICIISLVMASSVIRTARAQCECGYEVKGDRYTHAILTNFGRMLDVDDVSEGSGNELTDWEVQEWGVNASTRGLDVLLPKQNDAANVWVQGGALKMRQKAYSKADGEEGKPVSVAEIVTRRDDILYGSFRARYAIKVEENTSGGAVAGFFFYHGDASETDIEMLTRNDNTQVHYSNQPTYNYATDESYDNASLTEQLNTPWTEAQEHRWDWHPDVTYFYQDGRQAAELRVNVPQRKGRIMLNIWADDGEWSGYPADKDIVMEIGHIELFFNTSTSHSGGDTGFNEACEKAGGLDANTTCVVETGDYHQKSSAVRLLSWGGLAWVASALIWFFTVFA